MTEDVSCGGSGGGGGGGGGDGMVLDVDETGGGTG